MDLRQSLNDDDDIYHLCLKSGAASDLVAQAKVPGVPSWLQAPRREPGQFPLASL